MEEKLKKKHLNKINGYENTSKESNMLSAIPRKNERMDSMMSIPYSTNTAGRATYPTH
jgi:hypothetical protein